MKSNEQVIALSSDRQILGTQWCFYEEFSLEQVRRHWTIALRATRSVSVQDGVLERITEQRCRAVAW